MNIHAPKGGTLLFLIAVGCAYAVIVLFVVLTSPPHPHESPKLQAAGAPTP